MDKNYTYRMICQHQYGISFSQQEFIEENFAKMSIKDLCQKVFEDETINEQSKEYGDIKRFIARGKRKVQRVEFTEDQIAFIENNYSVMGFHEIAKTLFPDKDIKPLSSETQTVKHFIEALGLSKFSVSDSKTINEGDLEEYKPIKSNVKLIQKINAADPNARINSQKMKPIHKQYVEHLKVCLQSRRFLLAINSMQEEVLRLLFEEEFIKVVYDKMDLNAEELNMYITLCEEYTQQYQLQGYINKLEKKIEEAIYENDDDEDGKGGRVYQTYVELLDKRRAALKDSKSRTVTLQTNLSGSRTKRLDGQAKVNESLAKFVEEWKTEEGRRQALIIAEARNQALKKEKERLESMSEYIANIHGLGENEIIEN